MHLHLHPGQKTAPPMVVDDPLVQPAQAGQYNGRQITALPPEVLEKIFANLNGKDLVVCKGVSRAWQSAVAAPPLLSRVFYRRYHPLLPMPKVPPGGPSNYGETQHWLTHFNQEGRDTGARLDEELLTGERNRYFPQILFFSIARVLARAKVFDDCYVCTIRPSKRISSLCLSPDQRHLLINSDGSKIASINRRVHGQWREIGTIPDCNFVSDNLFSPNGEYFIGRLWSTKQTVKLWRTSSDPWQLQATLANDHMFPPCFSASGNHLLTNPSNCPQLSRCVDGQWRRPVSLKGGEHTDRAFFHPVEDILVTLQGPTTVNIWRFVEQTWQLDTSFQARPNLLDVCFSPDGHRMLINHISAAPLITMATYNRADRTWQIQAIIRPAKEAYGNHFSPKGNHLAIKFYSLIPSSSQIKRTYNLWRLVGHEWQEVTLANTTEFKHTCFSPDGDRLLTAARDNTTTLWKDLDGQWQPEVILSRSGEVTSACFSPHGLLAIAFETTVTIWGTIGGQWQKKADLPCSIPISEAIFSFDGQYIVTHNFQSNVVHIWTLKCKDGHTDAQTELVGATQ